ncbi:MauE/DoxX family redox-associated membrane protein [Streptomyces sp. NPDC002537]
MTEAEQNRDAAPRSVKSSLKKHAPWISTAVRFGLAATWFWAGCEKLLNADASVEAVRAYHVLPDGLVADVGFGLPAFELCLAVLLAVGLCTRFTAALSAVLLVLFMAAIAQAWVRGMSIDCGCFGGGGEVDPSRTRYVQELLRDTGFLTMSTWLIWRPHSCLSIEK